jgi:hypothetical protein
VLFQWLLTNSCCVAWLMMFCHVAHLHHHAVMVQAHLHNDTHCIFHARYLQHEGGLNIVVCVARIACVCFKVDRSSLVELVAGAVV